jgi:dienelactone hydrolase
MFRRSERPDNLRATLPHAFGALNYLAERPEIDPARIGAMGFSWGGGLSILLNSRNQGLQPDKPGRRFAASVAFYPSCYVFTPVAARPYTISPMTPLLVLAGEKDDYDRPDTCPKFREHLGAAFAERVTVHVFPGATHKWDGPGSESFFDSVANLGRGGQVTVRADRQVAEQSRQMSVDFFRKAFTSAN